MSLVADYSSSSEDEIPRDVEDEDTKKRLVKTILPSANILLSGSKPGEVFNNPYKEAENAKLASLEKHVKMVDTEEHAKVKNGKKICWNYRKGRCRFGSNCSFAHDSDVQKTYDTTDDDNNKTQNNIPSTPTISRPQHGLQIGHNTMKKFDQLPQKKEKPPVKRNRPGINDSVIPSKKVMKQYNSSKKHQFS